VYIHRNGKRVTAWNEVVRSLDCNEERWKYVSELCITNPKETIIVFCKRKKFVMGLHELLFAKGEVVDYMCGNKKTYNENARIVVVGVKKAGVGFDHKRLTMGIIATDMMDVRQIEGRVRKNNSKILHIVDDHPRLEDHYRECRKWYIERGGTMHEPERKIRKVKNASKPEDLTTTRPRLIGTTEIRMQ
jgi:hypothetical protein